MTPHSIVDTFYWYLLAVKLTLAPTLSSNTLYRHIHSCEELSSEMAENRGLSAISCSYISCDWLQMLAIISRYEAIKVMITH